MNRQLHRSHYSRDYAEQVWTYAWGEAAITRFFPTAEVTLEIRKRNRITKTVRVASPQEALDIADREEVRR